MASRESDIIHANILNNKEEEEEEKAKKTWTSPAVQSAVQRSSL